MKKLGHGIYLCKNEKGFEKAVLEFTAADVNVPFQPQRYPCLVLLSMHLHSIVVREVPIDILKAKLIDFES